MLKDRYKAFEIRDDDVSQTIVEGSLPAIACYIAGCHEGSIITIHTPDGEPFLIGLSKMFLYCEDKKFLDCQLLPYLRGMDGESA